MTSGTKTLDSRVSTSHSYRDCFNVVVNYTITTGSYYSKTWNGGDTPTSVRSSQRPNWVKYRIYNSRGEWVGTRRRNLASPQTPYSHGFTENGYTLSVTNRQDGTGIRQDSCSSTRRATHFVDSTGRPNYYQDKPSPWTSNEDLALSGKMGEALGQEFNLAIFLGEGREALGTIAQSATKVYKAYKAARKGNVSGAFRILTGKSRSASRKAVSHTNAKTLADRWLEIQYAWKPLLDDAYGAAKHLAYMQNRPAVKTYRVGKTMYREDPLKIFNYDISGSKFVRKGIVARVTHVNEAALLGLTDPASLAWELLPYSFVADWFIPIGSYLEALTLRGALTGTFISSSKHITATTRFVYPWDGYASEDVSYLVRDVTFQRSVGSAMPAVQLPRLKTLEKALSFQHALNAVSLLVSSFSGR
jgi:hypothetical protein